MADDLADDPELLRVLQACYESWSRGSAPPEQRSICHSWLTGPYQELFGETFHQGRLRTLARMGFLREDNSSRGGHRRYYTIPDPDRVAALVKNIPVSPLAGLLTQAIIIPGDRTSEGTLITAVAVPWMEIVKMLHEDPSLAFKIDPWKWEEIIAGAYKRAGFEEVTLTPRSGDHGRDVIAVKRGMGCVRFIDSVKRYGPDRSVPADDVRALLGVLLTDHNATKGILTTTSNFAPMIACDPFIKPHIPFRLELVDGQELNKRLWDLAKDRAEPKRESP
jgi:restriction system protein